MKRVIQVVFVTCALALLAQPAQAQQWSADQLEVWETVSTMWDLGMADDPAWKDLIHDSFMGWVDESPMPHDKETTLRFIDAEAGHFKTLVQHITPMAIVVTGNTAVVHYVHMSITEFDDGDRETGFGRFTDVLTLTGDGWRIVSWVGHERSEEDSDY